MYCGSSGKLTATSAWEDQATTAQRQPIHSIFPIKNRQQCFRCAKADFLTADKRFVKQSFLEKAARSQQFFFHEPKNADQLFDL